MEKSALESYITNLVNLPLSYIQKISGTEFYGFGFGQVREYPSRNIPGRINRMTDYALHILCPFELIHRIPEHKTHFIDFETSLQEFESIFRSLIGKRILRVRITSNNDLRIDFGSAWITTLVNGDSPGAEEAWRLFQPNSPNLHLVATQKSIDFR